MTPAVTGVPPSLVDPIDLGAHRAPSRALFGPHPTNLGDDRHFSARHVAYYARRARGGAGLIVTEEAAVHPSDWPYERSPLAATAGPGWAAITTAVHADGALCIAALGHTGGQGSSAYSQRELWAPSRVPEVASREVPKWMEDDDIAAVIAGFGDAAAIATAAGCDGVEVNAGQHSLVRQFLSGLTNHRGDRWGQDRTTFARAVIAAVRASVAPGSLVGLRLSCDELAPWAGITPDHAVEIAAALAPLVDYLVVVRGSIFSIEQTRPDLHVAPTFNRELCGRMAAAVDVPVVLQGSVVAVADADTSLADGTCQLVEMTRAQIADPDLVTKVRRQATHTVRPCLRCNQTCMVRDARNPRVTCVVEPTAGYETEDPDWHAVDIVARRVLVVGAGPAGLEAARVAQIRGHQVDLVDTADTPGGLARIAGPGAPLVAWQLAELARAGITVQRTTPPTSYDVVIQCTGGRPGERTYEADHDAIVTDVVTVWNDPDRLPAHGPIALFDPIGGPIAVALAEHLGARAVLITPDNIAGNELSRSGDLAPANVRLQQLGVRIERRAILRRVTAGTVELEDRFSGERRTIDAVALVDCGFRLPDDHRPGAQLRAGDCVAPRTLLEAVLEGRRAAAAIARV